MKLKINIILLAFLFTISFSACSINKTSSPISNNDSSSDQVVDNITSSSNSSEVTTKEIKSLLMDKYKAILQNKDVFISTNNNNEVFLNDFFSRNSEYEGTYKVTHFTVLDMDGDQTPEVILELSLDYPEQYEILYYCNGKVYGYNVVYRDFKMLKEDGTYSYSNSASDVGIKKISSFEPTSVEMETMGYTQVDYNTSNTEISYFVNDTSVTKEVFDAFLEKQNEKKDVDWYEFSTENIETKITINSNSNSFL